MDLGIYPSPYTTGEFDHWVDGKFYLPIETNRGCPYGCTFCDWGAATLAKIARLSDERVFGEVGVRGETQDPHVWGSAMPTSASCRATSTSRASSSR